MLNEDVKMTSQAMLLQLSDTEKVFINNLSIN